MGGFGYKASFPSNYKCNQEDREPRCHYLSFCKWIDQEHNIVSGFQQDLFQFHLILKLKDPEFAENTFNYHEVFQQLNIYDFQQHSSFKKLSRRTFFMNNTHFPEKKGPFLFYFKTKSHLAFLLLLAKEALSIRFSKLSPTTDLSRLTFTLERKKKLN